MDLEPGAQHQILGDVVEAFSEEKAAKAAAFMKEELKGQEWAGLSEQDKQQILKAVTVRLNESDRSHLPRVWKFQQSPTSGTNSVAYDQYWEEEDDALDILYTLQCYTAHFEAVFDAQAKLIACRSRLDWKQKKNSKCSVM